VRLATVVLADASDTRRGLLRLAATGTGCAVREAASVGDVPSICRAIQPGALVVGCDDRGFAAALGIVAAVRRLDPAPAVLLVVENGSEALAVAALRAGVHDYLRHPVAGTELGASLSRVAPPRPVSMATPVNRVLLGSSPAMKRVQAYLDQAAQCDANVLITGETGTGKELAAAYLHNRSARHRRPLVTINCAAIPDALLESELFGHEKGAFTGATALRPGLLESANGGTVFLDEIGEMGLQAQAKILRAIESREVYRVGGRGRVPLDVRIVAATNQDLEAAVESGRFRRDLYFRLHVASVSMPPLRERPVDIGELLDHYLREFNTRAQWKVGISDEARCALDAYEWPGNVRELKNLVESLFICPPERPIRIADMPETFRRRLDRFCAAGDAERRALLDALFHARWNKKHAAEVLKCSRMTLYRRMAKYSVVRSTPDAPAGRKRKA
jgi:DNA-binding NtrC family response regulator